MEGNVFLKWAQDFITGGSTLTTWILTPIKITESWTVSPLLLVSIGGLIVFISLAVVFWVLSSSPL